MNLFILSYIPTECAEMMMDVHIVKIILEAVQMLSTAKRVLEAYGSEYDKIVNDGSLTKKDLQLFKVNIKKKANLIDIPVYKVAHVAHPVCIWVRKNYENYYWTLELVEAMHNEWRYRYGHSDKVFHKSYLVAQYLKMNPPPFVEKSEIRPTTFALAMPEEYKFKNETTGDYDFIQSYRCYYKSPMKKKLAVWRKRGQPNWW